MKLIKNHFRLEVIATSLLDEVVLNKLINQSTQYISIFTRYGSRLVPAKKFYIEDLRNKKIIFNINQLNDIVRILEENKISYEIETKVYNKVLISVKTEVKKGFGYRDELQKRYAKFLDETESDCYLCTLQTGKGKTGSTIINLFSKPTKSRLVILIPPKFNVVWIKDLKKFTNIRDKDILQISGRDSLLSLDEIPNNVSVVIMSPPTLREYLKDYYSDADVSFDPSDFMKLIGAEYLIIDEGHEDFAGNYSNVLALNPPKLIVLTASYESTQDHKIVTRHKGYLLPEEARLPEEPYDKYVNMVFCQFQFRNPSKLKHTVDGKGWYNHSELENSILKNYITQENYFEMILWFISQYYNPKYRLLVLMARKDACVAFAEYIKNSGMYKNKNVTTYVQGDSKDCLKADIIISTKQSAGTGIDIQNVQTTMNTINTKSEYAGKQFSGRTRFMEDVEQYYLILWATNIDAHRNYKKVNTPLYKKMAKVLSSNYYNRKPI